MRPILFLVGSMGCSPDDSGRTPPSPPAYTETAAPSGSGSPAETGGLLETGTSDTAPVEVVPNRCEDAQPPLLRINEAVPANVAGRVDGRGATSDWFEIINRDAGAVDLAGWTLEDEDTTWTLPASSVEPGALWLVVASGDATEVEGEVHAPFELDAEGEDLVLRDPDGCEVDRAELGRIYADVSYGRPSDDPDTWAYFLEPTPGRPNTTESRPGFAEPPDLSPPSGFVPGPVAVRATAPLGGTVRWTFDASEPDETDPIAGAITVDAAPGFAVVRARTFVDGLWPSRVSTGTWSADSTADSYGLQVVSLVVDPYDLYDEATGIYTYGPPDYTPSYPYFGANFWEDWERPAHAVVIDADGATAVDQDLGVKIHGGYTRAFEQKSLRLLPGSAFGATTMEHRFFPLEDLASFEKIVLEGAGDWCPTHTENAVVDQLFRDAEGRRFAALDTQAWEPTVVYLNGAFWGLYAFREKLDETWISAHHGADPENLDRIECTADGSDDWWRLSQGTWERFDELEAFVATHDLADAAHWSAFQAFMDVDNLAITVLAEAYMANADWWSNNLRMWRERVDPGPFRHMVFDLGHGWPSASYDHIGVSVRFSGPGLPIANALRNPEFVAILANQASDLLNTSLSPEVALLRLQGMHERIEPVIPAQYATWCGATPATWYSGVAYAEGYVQQRPDVLWADLEQHLGLSTVVVSLETDPPGAGTFQLTLVEVDAPFEGRFFAGVPVRVAAVPAEGWTFGGWDDPDLGDDASAEVVLAGDRTIVATFY